jgi:hypothetical protein
VVGGEGCKGYKGRGVCAAQSANAREPPHGRGLVMSHQKALSLPANSTHFFHRSAHCLGWMMWVRWGVVGMEPKMPLAVGGACTLSARVVVWMGVTVWAEE